MHLTFSALGQRQRQRGCVVRSMRLEDSPHCGHFRSHTAQYCAAVAAFLQHDLQVLHAPNALRCTGLPQAAAGSHAICSNASHIGLSE